MEKKEKIIKDKINTVNMKRIPYNSILFILFCCSFLVEAIQKVTNEI